MFDRQDFVREDYDDRDERGDHSARPTPLDEREEQHEQAGHREHERCDACAEIAVRIIQAARNNVRNDDQHRAVHDTAHILLVTFAYEDTPIELMNDFLQFYALHLTARFPRQA